jgi:hypothetical protein
MRSATGRRTQRSGRRSGSLLLVFGLSTGLIGGSVGLAPGAASGAVAGSKATITVKDCTTTSCMVTFTIRAVVKVTPTGTVSFGTGGATVMAAGGGSCSDEPMVATKGVSAAATCDATDLPQGRHKITATYSGDDNLDPSTTTKAIRVRDTP